MRPLIVRRSCRIWGKLFYKSGKFIKITIYNFNWSCINYGIMYPLSSAFSTILINLLHCAADGSEFRFMYSAILPINATSPYDNIFSFDKSLYTLFQYSAPNLNTSTEMSIAWLNLRSFFAAASSCFISYFGINVDLNSSDRDNGRFLHLFQVSARRAKLLTKPPCASFSKNS